MLIPGKLYFLSKENRTPFLVISITKHPFYSSIDDVKVKYLIGKEIFETSWISMSEHSWEEIVIDV